MLHHFQVAPEETRWGFSTKIQAKKRARANHRSLQLALLEHNGGVVCNPRFWGITARLLLFVRWGFFFFSRLLSWAISDILATQTTSKTSMTTLSYRNLSQRTGTALILSPNCARKHFCTAAVIDTLCCGAVSAQKKKDQKPLQLFGRL